MNRLTVCLAGIPIGVECEDRFMERLCADYLTDETPLFSVSASKETVLAELKNADGCVSYGCAEALCLYRAMAERLPEYDRMVFHGAAVEYEGKAYLFTAPSKTGKSTHIRLWRQFLGEKVRIINGDKPILHLTAEGVTVCGTPYAGKEGWQRNVQVPLGGICVLSQGKENRLTRPKTGVFVELFRQTYKPLERRAAEKTVSLVKALCRARCCFLACTISEEAVKLSFEALTNQVYKAENHEDQ